MTIHTGDLVVTSDNVEYARTLTEVWGSLDISAENATLPALTEVSGWVSISAEGASLPALTEAGSLYIYAEGASLPTLTKVSGRLHISAEGASLPALTKVSGWVDIYAAGASLPALTNVSRWVDIRAEGVTLPALTEAGYLGIRAEGASLPLMERNGWEKVGGRVNHRYLSGPVTRDGKSVNVEWIDGHSMIINGWKERDGISVTSAKYFGGGDFDNLARCCVAKQGGTYAHGDSLKQAVDDLTYKLLQSSADTGDLVEEIKGRGCITIPEYRALTGACQSGVMEFLRQKGIDPARESLPISEVVELTRDAFGGEKIARLFPEATQ